MKRNPQNRRGSEPKPQAAIHQPTQRTDQRTLQTNHTAAACFVALATARLNDAIHDHVVALAARNGSTTAPGVRYVHFANASAKAIGLPKSDAAVIAALPIEDRAILSLVRAGIAARIPFWAAQVETEGGAKPHNRILSLAKAWATTEALALRACGIEDVIGQAEALLALEVSR